MLFNSYTFLFLFLPTTYFCYYQLEKFSNQRIKLFWLVLVSLFFYGWWNPIYVSLIVSSIVFNYYFGRLIWKYESNILLIFSITVNLLLIGYFKYTNFFIDSINNISGSDFNLEQIVLPLAISFFTFQQIAYLVDVYRKKVEKHDLLQYSLFVLFFPQLIAGPIVHHQEMLPQFLMMRTSSKSKNLGIGITILIIGLFKKVIIADGIAIYSTAVFNAVDSGATVTFFEAWGGAFAYTSQLYFDFSGYSDMAIGIARMFGIKLPENFNSPYKSNNIIDFWKRWHITLSRFLRDYLYFTLGGNRKGRLKRYINLLITMFLCGLWHGAGWTFVIWGCLHGIFLVINHAWRYLKTHTYLKFIKIGYVGIILSRLITFLTVVVAWVFFRAENFSGAINMLKGMSGRNGFILPEELSGILPDLCGTIQFSGTTIGTLGHYTSLFWVMLLLFIVWFTPNTYEWVKLSQMGQGGVGLKRILILPGKLWVIMVSSMGILVAMYLNEVSEFLYFNF